MPYRLVVLVVVAAHFAFLGYVIAGGFLAYRWPRAIWPHLAAVAWAVLIVAKPLLACPLTATENWARKRAGMASYTGGFIDRYVKGVFYPVRFERETQVLVLAIVLVSWVLAYAHHRTRRDAGSHPAPDARRAER